MKRCLTIIASLALIVAGCATTEHGSGNVGYSDITGYEAVGLYSPDAAFRLIEDKGMQVCVNPERSLFRLQNGDQTVYVNVQFSSKPEDSAGGNSGLSSSCTFITSPEH